MPTIQYYYQSGVILNRPVHPNWLELYYQVQSHPIIKMSEEQLLKEVEDTVHELFPRITSSCFFHYDSEEDYQEHYQQTLEYVVDNVLTTKEFMLGYVVGVEGINIYDLCKNSILSIIFKENDTKDTFEHNEELEDMPF